MSLINAYIQSIHCTLGEHCITNKNLAEFFPDFSQEQIAKSSGVNTRYSVGKDGIASQFASTNALEFFARHQINPKDIDFLIFCTEGPDYIAPATSCIIHEKISLPTHTGTLDLSFGCSGYTYGLMMAKALVESGMYNTILFITADIPTQVVSKRDPYLNFIFSDAASSTLISAKPIGLKIGKFVCGTDGSGEHHLKVEHSGFVTPKDQNWFHDPITRALRVGEMVMNGEEIFRFSLREVPRLVNDILEKNNCCMEDIDFFVFHQASQIILKSLRRKMSIPEEKFYSNLDKYGNTVSASIPLCLEDLANQGRIKPGNKVLIAGFGIGFSWSGTILYL